MNLVEILPENITFSTEEEISDEVRSLANNICLNWDRNDVDFALIFMSDVAEELKDLDYDESVKEDRGLYNGILSSIFVLAIRQFSYNYASEYLFDEEIVERMLDSVEFEENEDA